jgi:hypothetical protein
MPGLVPPWLAGTTPMWRGLAVGVEGGLPSLDLYQDDLIEKFYQFRWIASSITQGRPVAAAQIDTAMLGWPTSPAISLWPAARWTRRSSR